MTALWVLIVWFGLNAALVFWRLWATRERETRRNGSTGITRTVRRR